MTREKVALVTGVSSGIGQATASLLVDRGFRVFGTMRKPSGTDGQLANVERVRLDVRDEESVRSCVRTVLDRAGRIDPADRKSTRLNSSHLVISYAVFCLKKKNKLCSKLRTGYCLK